MNFGYVRIAGFRLTTSASKTYVLIARYQFICEIRAKGNAGIAATVSTSGLLARSILLTLGSDLAFARHAILSNGRSKSHGFRRRKPVAFAFICLAGHLIPFLWERQPQLDPPPRPPVGNRYLTREAMKGLRRVCFLAVRGLHAGFYGIYSLIMLEYLYD